jgi:hypothetical protein
MLNFVNGPHQKNRTAPGPVVGWPPIRSFRKNLATSSSSKPSQPESQTQQHNNNNVAAGKKPIDYNYSKGLFVKINMDGVPIGRKVDLNAYHSYENLSSAVDELFRGLLKGINICCVPFFKFNHSTHVDRRVVNVFIYLHFFPM